MHTLYFQGVALSSQYGIESMHSFHPEALVLNAPVLFLQTSYNEFINLKISNHVYVKLSPIYISCFCRNNRIIAYFSRSIKSKFSASAGEAQDSATRQRLVVEYWKNPNNCCSAAVCSKKKKRWTG
jgi:hypothetical protein